VSRPVVLVVGMRPGKDATGFLRNFLGLARRLVAVPISGDGGMPPESVAEAARAIGMPADAQPSVAAALVHIAALDLAPPPRILITGSLYLAGDVLAANGTPPQ
jgi:dihydrofolate synthase / folylpolyglutamate synthase